MTLNKIVIVPSAVCVWVGGRNAARSVPSHVKRPTHEQKPAHFLLFLRRQLVRTSNDLPRQHGERELSASAS